jgi:hypothetical protein
MLDTGWSRAFDEPIPLPRGRQLVTLKESIGMSQRCQRATFLASFKMKEAAN